MAITVTIAGVDKTSYIKLESLKIQMQYRAAWSASFDTKDILSTASAYVPTLNDTVVVADGATTVFRGWVFGLGHGPIDAPNTGTLVRVSCKAYDALLDAILVDKTYGTDPLGIANSSVASPTSITTVQPHGYVTGDRVIIEDHVGSTAAVNGTHAVTVTSHSTFTVAVNNLSSGGGGTVRKVTRSNVIVDDLHDTYLSGRGVSLDTLSTGDDISKLVLKDVPLREALDLLTTNTGWPYRITPDPELQFFSVGDKTLSYSLTYANGNEQGPVTWEKHRQRYVNKVTLRYGSDGVVAKTDTITLDASTVVFPLKYTPATDVNGVILSTGYVNENATTNYPLALLSDIVSSSVANPTTITTLQPHGLDTGSTHSVVIQSHSGSTPAISGTYTATVTGLRSFTIPVNVTVAGTGGSVYESGFTWLYYPTTNSLFRVGAGTSEQIALFTYSAQFPQAVTAIDGAGDWEGVFKAPDIYDTDAAQQLADGLLRKELATPQTVTLQTRQGFVMPGDVIALAYTDRAVASADYLVQQVSMSTDTTQQFIYQITAVSGEEFKDTALDIQRDALNGAGLQRTGGTITGGGVVPAPSAMSPDNVVAKSGSITEEVEIGAVSAGTVTSLVTGHRFTRSDNMWAVGVRPAQSPGSSGYEYVWFNADLSTAYPTLRLVQDGVNVIMALDATFTSTVRGVQLGENASGKRFESVNSLILRANQEMFERGRAAANGIWTVVSYADANYSGNVAGNADWVVDDADEVTSYVMPSGRTMTVNVYVVSSDVANAPTQLRVLIPGGHTCARRADAVAILGDAGGTLTSCAISVDPAVSTTHIIIGKFSGAFTNTSSDNTSVQGQITFETGED